MQHLARGIFAEADAGHQIVRRGHAVFGGDARVVGFLKLGERDFVFARFALQQLAADFDGALALMLVEPVLDFVAGARALDEGEPVAAGRVAVLRDDFDDVAVAQLRCAAAPCGR